MHPCGRHISHKLEQLLYCDINATVWLALCGAGELRRQAAELQDVPTCTKQSEHRRWEQQLLLFSTG